MPINVSVEAMSVGNDLREAEEAGDSRNEGKVDPVKRASKVIAVH